MSPISVPTIKRVKGEMKAKRIMKGMARKMEISLSQKLNQNLFSKIPPGSVKTRMTPKKRPRTPPKIDGQKVM